MNSGTHLLSTGNETGSLCQAKAIEIDEPTKEIIVEMPARSLNTYIFMIEPENTAIEETKQTDNDGAKTYYDLQGRKMERPRGICVEKSANGRSRIVMMRR